MQTRAVREGSVGLFLLLGVGVLAGLILWVRGLRVGERSYNVYIEFPKVNGLQEGAAVRFRGVTVGQIKALNPRPNGVEVKVEVTPADLVMSRDVLVEANQSGFLGEVSVDIAPLSRLPVKQVGALPLDSDCDRSLIVCNNSRLQGQIGVSTDELIRFTTRFASVYSNQELYSNVNAAAKNASIAAAEVAQLTREISSLSKVTRQQLGSISTTANSLQRAANQASASTTEVATKFGATADQLRLTAAQANRLLANIDNLVTTNRSSLVTALNNLTTTSQQLRTTVNTLTPTVNRVTQGELIANLETLTANAAQASANLRDVSNALNNPTNLLVLQQTLDSARVTFQNAQKITSDLDELTGDPTFRNNVRELVNGLSSLVSSTQQVQQQVQVAETLDSLTVTVRNSHPDRLKFSANNKSQQLLTHTADVSRKIDGTSAREIQPEWLLRLKASSSKQGG